MTTCLKVFIKVFLLSIVIAGFPIDYCMAMEVMQSPFEMPPRENPELLANMLDFRAPTAMAFDSRNRPYLFNTRDPEGYGFIMTLRQDKWINLSYIEALQKAIPNIENPTERHWFATGMLTIDDSDAIYAIVPVWRKFPSAKGKQSIGVRLAGSVLLYSPDLGKTFQVYKIDGLQAMEAHSGYNDLSSPPVIALLKQWKNYSTRWAAYHELSILIPRKKGNALELGEPIFVTDVCSGMTVHSGGHSFAATRGRNTHIVYTEIPKGSDSEAGNPTFIATIDRQQREVLSKKFIAAAHPKFTDAHSTPVIALDRKGYLHVICGSHNGPFQYSRSLQPNDILPGWTKPANIWASQTYATLVIDQKSQLHSVFREKLQLMHDGKESDSQVWDKPVVVVKKPKNYAGYTVFYHHLFIDRVGTLYLSFTFYEHKSGKEWRTPTVLTASTDGGKKWYLAKKETFKEHVHAK